MTNVSDQAAHHSDDNFVGWERLSQFAVLVTLVSFFAYVRTVDYGFVGDDGTYLGVHNNFLVELPVSELWRLLVAPANPWEFLPVRDLSYWLDAKLFGLGSEGFHASNIAWYGLACWAAYFALRETLNLDRAIPAGRVKALAAVGAMLFAIHPAHVEAVAWISGRKDILAGLFVFLGWGWIARASRTGWVWRDAFWAFLFLTMACFAKSSAVAAVGMILLVLATGWARQNPLGLGASKATLWLGLALLALIVTALIVHSVVGHSRGIGIVNDPGFAAKIERASRILAANFEIIFVPFDMGLFHDVYAYGSWHWIIGAGVVAVTLWAVVVLLRGRQVLMAFGVLWTVLPLLPYLQLMPFTTWSMASERFVFQASLGAVLLVTALISRLDCRAAFLATGAFALCLLTLTLARIPDWALDANLFLKEAEKNPTFYISGRHAVIAQVKKKDFLAASAAIEKVERADAREVLYSWLRHKQRTQASDGQGKAPAENQKRFCQSLQLLDAELAKHFAIISTEPDIPFNNLLANTVRGEYPGRKIPKSCLPHLS